LTQARDEVSSLPGLNTTVFTIPVDATSADAYLQTIVRLRSTVVAIANRQATIVGKLLNHGYMQLYTTATQAAMIYLNQLDYVPTFLPAGTLLIESLEATSEKQADFLTAIAETSLKRGSIFAYDAVHTIAQGIKIASGQGAVTRSSLNASIANLDFESDFSGRIRFGASGYRVDQTAHILVANSTATPGVLSLSMVYNGTLYDVAPPLWPGASMIPVDDQTIFIPMGTMMAFSSSLIPSQVRIVLQRFFSYYTHWINKQPDLLPKNTKILNIVVDNFGIPSVATQYALLAPTIGSVCMFGDYTPTLTAVTQSIYSGFSIPHMSTTPSSILSNKQLFPTLTRAVSTSAAECETILSMAKGWGWTELTIISSGNTFGSETATLMDTEAVSYGITIENHLTLSNDVTQIEAQLNELWKKEPQIVVLLVSENVFEALSSFHKTGYRPAAVVTDIMAALNVTAYAELGGLPVDFFEGWISLHTPIGRGHYWDTFLANASVDAQNDPLRWGMVAPLLPTVLSTATELDSFVIAAKSVKQLVESGYEPTDGARLLSTIRSFQGTLFSGEIKFDSNGDRLPTFDVLNAQGGFLQVVGRWTRSSGLDLSSEIVWPSKTTDIPLSSLPREIKWLKWNSGAGIVLATLAIIGIVASLVILGAIYTWRESPIIISATWQFLILMLLGSAVGFGSTLVWIGKPQPYLCALRIWLPPISFLLIIAPLMAKTWRLWKIFSLTDLKVVAVPLRTLILMVSALILVQVIICIFWISFGTVQTQVVNDINNKTVAYLLCKTNEANRISSYVTYGYIGMVILWGCYLTFKIRKLPKDFNESKWIGRTLYNIFLFAGLIIILGYALSRFYVVVSILICVCTLAICYGSIFLMMAPKVFTLIKHPEKRSSDANSTRMTDRKGAGSAEYSNSIDRRKYGSSTM
jgi:ABC-type branched-subunit amino acid transport system substrate-binding protein